MGWKEDKGEIAIVKFDIVDIGLVPVTLIGVETEIEGMIETEVEVVLELEVEVVEVKEVVVEVEDVELVDSFLNHKCISPLNI